MKKLFLIPLLACFSCVMAWGENVAIAQIGETTYYQGDAADAENHIYETAQAALNATIADVANEGTIKLLSSVEGSFALAEGLNKTVTLDVNGKTLSKASATVLDIYDGSKLILINTDTSNDGYITSGSWTVLCRTNAEFEINDGVTIQSSGSNNAIYGYANSTITINGGTVKYIGTATPDLINCVGCTLTINGGTIENTTKWDAIYAKNGAQITINGGLITNTCTGTAGYAIDLYGNTSGSGDPIATTLTINGGSIVSNTAQKGYGISIWGNGATLNMTDGAITANHFAITGNGTAKYGGTTINISGGSLSSSAAEAAIYHPQAGTLNITGGTITGKTGIGIKGGTVNISGGTIHGVGNNGGRVEGYNNGLHSSFAAVQIESNPGYAGNMNITVSDNATLISDSWYAFYEYLSNPEGATKVTSIAVTGGHFQGGILLSQSLAAKGGFVSGGKWTKDISANIKAGENLSLLNNEDTDNPPYLYLVGVPTPAQEEAYAEITNQPNTSDPSKNNNAVLTNAASESAAQTYTSDNVGTNTDDIDVITTKVTNPVVVSENTDVVATEAAPVVEVKKVTVDNDAQLTVTDGATLMVGAGAITLDESSNNGLTVEAGATLVVDGLIYGSTEDNFVIESQEGKSGIVLFSPETEFIKEDHPKATYRFISKAFWTQAESKWVYQRFGVPTFDGHATLQWINNPGGGVNSWVKKWDYENDDWTSWAAFSGDVLEINDAIPFQGLMLASDNPKPDNTHEAMVYEFTGSLMGNMDANLHFYYGWNYYANSYTAPININEFIKTVKTSLGGSNDILATIYLYQDLGNDTYTWQAVNEFTAGSSTVVGFAPGVGPIYENVPSVINPMQAFLMRLNVQGQANQKIDYEDNVYTPATVNTFNPAPARNKATNNSMQISVFNANGNFDKVFFVENDNFSNDLDNGFDAYKYDGNKGVSLYAMSADKHMEILASNDVDGSFIGIDAPEAGNYTLYFSGVKGMDYSLIDMTNNTVVTIEEGGQYNFEAEKGQNDYRFQLVAPVRTPTAIENAAVKASVKGVYTITGQYLGEDINALPKGVYILNGAKVVK